MFEAVIFDIDGVLVESEEFYMKRRMKFFDEMGIEPGSRNINHFVGGNKKKSWEILVPDDEKLRTELEEKYFNDFEPQNEIDFEKYSRKNLINVFDKLRSMGIKISLASAGTVKNIEKFIDKMKLDDFIEFYVSGETCEYNKPHPDIYLQSIKRLGMKPEDILVVEDSQTGIKSAKSANLTVIAFKQENLRINQSEADYIINNLDQIFDYI